MGKLCKQLGIINSMGSKLRRIEEIDQLQFLEEATSVMNFKKESLNEELEEVAQAEEIFWRQNSIYLWVKHRDMNMRFFHRLAYAHKR